MSDFRIYSPDLGRFIRAFERAPSLVQSEIRHAMEDTVLVAEGEVLKLTPVRTGRLRRSLESSVEGNGPNIRARIAFEGVDYAAAVEFGTRPHTIVPKSGKALRFNIAGRVVFARSVRHPGTAGVHMMEHGLRNARPHIDRLFERALERVNQRLAGK